MLRAFLTAYPWDLIDEGAATVLDRLHGEIGLSGVAVWACTPPVLQLRARDIAPRVFETRGGSFFHPDGQYYAATRCKPIASERLKGRDPLKSIADACAERAMELRVIVSAAYTGRLAQRHPEMACKNVYGAQSRHAVCLANPDVQTFLAGLLPDLHAHCDPTGISLTDFVVAWSEAFDDNLRAPVTLGPSARALLSTCFCESCHQRAGAKGVDVEMVSRSVRAIMQRTLDAAADHSLDSILADNAPLAAYYKWRSEELSSLLGRLNEQCGCELLLDRRLTGPESCQYAGVDLGIPAGVITRLDRPDELSAALCPLARRNELRLPESFAIGAHGPDLVSTISRAVELGVSAVQIDSYGLLPEASLTPVRQAIRFARRKTGE